MKIDVLNLKKEKSGTIDLPERIFGLKWNSDLVHQALLAQLANRREPIAHAKGRGEVSGGGKKPWKQKGTGRARHGSIRSPLWKGGGVTFGPTKEKIFAKKINKKMNRLAIFSVLSKRVNDNNLQVVDGLSNQLNKEKKTKTATKTLKNISNLKSTLLILPSSGKEAHRTISNLKNTDAISSYSLNVFDLMKYKNIIMEKEAVEEINKHYK
ncbi:50S ribosomal protein L4 [Candidatus Wolfebacteria bacterium RIFCSPLOWO2_01_FULL_38_11]|uniref:Large ribosomal subunit protein uL4 n=2 Tax=Candidatus Wolfeibacteriota TaxID=1752735 RepID=A0A0G0IGJ6_9BACT|nr:MAG: ribosomal protein L4/L1e, large subunit ribosomal protein L4 [Candidatus Wolfebacteria bacterium GW2011_GWC1_37_10]OGM91354.1 MAG: 50S ribosomal protein L4 [Candidatus Wolfebacteria bacterium RIFCSPLOWO2_01_FULL_38_11]